MARFARTVAVFVGLLCVAATGRGEPASLGFGDGAPDEQSIVTDAGVMTAYTDTLPGADIAFDMVPVPGGEFRLGSPDSEAGRREDEGPVAAVSVPPFWIGRCEVTWAEFRYFMGLYDDFKQLGQMPGPETPEPVVRYLKASRIEVDAVTCPTPLYDASFTYAAGEDPRQPAVTMTQFAARQYTKWLSRVTGRDYRLPSEVEWEYAARAGAETAYAFGDDPAGLGDYAWFEANSDGRLHRVGEKAPNAWGLHDMHGNAAELVLDQYSADAYSGREGDSPDVAWPTEPYPFVVRGGCWYDGPEGCRSAARRTTVDEEWKLSDPNFPESPWWYTERPTTGIGFRIVRPLEPMDAETRTRAWEPNVETLKLDVADRLDEGRGAQAAADPRLPDAVRALRSARR